MSLLIGRTRKSVQVMVTQHPEYTAGGCISGTLVDHDADSILLEGSETGKEYVIFKRHIVYIQYI